ncbi:MAG: hypothetical protein JST42_15975 [Bacteroidetes bacterium]|nr:hypothetical protein [Bacteroidota bacterium]
MRLTTGGFLGLGTTAPAGRLHFVSQSSESGDDYIFDDYRAGINQGRKDFSNIVKLQHGSDANCAWI